MSDLDFISDEARMWAAVDSAFTHAENVAAMDAVLDADRPVDLDDEHDQAEQ